MSILGLARSLHKIGAVKFGEFTLKSGKKSPYYIDLRVLPSYPDVMTEVGKAMSKVVAGLCKRPTGLCGIPIAGLAIATMAGAGTGIPVVYTRKEPTVYRDLATMLRNLMEARTYQDDEIPGVKRVLSLIDELSGLKAHGIARYVEGELKNGDEICIVDDVITTAESKLEARDLLLLEARRRSVEIEITEVCVVLDREQGGKEVLEKAGMSLHSIMTITEVADQLRRLRIMSTEEYKTLMEYTRA